MTEPAEPGASTPRTRSQRRRDRSWWGRRRARKHARRRRARAAAAVSPEIAETPIPDVVQTEAVAPPAVELTPEPELELTPEPEPAPAPAVQVVTVARRSRGSKHRRAAKPARAARPARARAPSRTTKPTRGASRTSSRFWSRTVPIIAAVLATLVGIGAVARAVDSGGAATPTASAHHPLLPKTTLLVHHSALFGNDLMVLFGRDRGEGSVLLIPGATQLDVPARGVATLGAVPVDDNAQRLTNSVENVLGVRVGSTVVLDDAGLTADLGPAAPLAVTLTAPAEITSSGTKYPSGAQQLSAAQASDLMSGPQSVNELDRLVTASAVIDAWLTRLKSAPVAKRTIALAADLGQVVATAEAADYRIDTLPVDSIATGGGERFAIREPELIRYVRRAFPRSRLGAASGRPRVEILNGTGFLGVAQAVSDKVVPAGGKVTLTNNLPGFGNKTTQIVYYKDAWRGAAQHLVDAMGCGSLRKATKDPGISDVTILVGTDCPAYGVPPGGSN